MRRIDRQINTKEELRSILKEGKVIHVAFQDIHEPYMVTMNYGFTWGADAMPRFYFHCAPEGRKVVIINANPRVCFSVYLCDPFVTGEKACNYGMKYRSVVGYGTMRPARDNEEKAAGLNLLMEQYTGKSAWSYDDDIMKKTAVYCLEADRISGKQKK